jgi:tRNA 2-thiouridine synthesizing protein E
MADPESTVGLDPEGFLINLDDWNPSVAQDIANGEGIILTEQHWAVLTLLRQYYAEFDSSPAMRPLVNYCGMALGKDKGKSLYLLTLFPGSPAKIGCKIAGLPKPDNCL